MRKKAPRSRRKGQFKLRFHHQALPQEYLDHYEASQKNLRQKHTESTTATGATGALSSVAAPQAALTVADSTLSQQEMHTNESVRNWLQKISEYQSEPPKASLSANTNGTTNDERSAVASHSTAGTVTGAINDDANKQTRVVSYNDLPYMGEMTLANSKPRRGRKPKKADICHLIYKNYGTILPGTPPKTTNECIARAATTITVDAADSQKSDVQNGIINSLLVKRLIDDDIDIVPASSPSNDAADGVVTTLTEAALGQRKDEPLNLCVRDCSDTMTVSSVDVDDDIESLLGSSRSTPLTIAPADLGTDAMLAANLKMALPNFHSALLDGRPLPSDTPSDAPSTTSAGGDSSNTGTTANSLMYWPGAGVFLHPMALYYQKILDGTASLPINTTAAAAVATTTMSASTRASHGGSSPASTPSPKPQKNGKSTEKILVPKNISQLLKQQHKPKASVASDNGKAFSIPKTPSDNSSSSSRSMNNSAAIKRKRSAIFIPPMPNETASNHATEVSICKFKFTGGAKPSLQEKKMLSVDAGGNFRYYSGTGDKSIRGYEFFPRESLQQASLTTNSSAGAFLNTPGKRIPVDQSLPSHGLSNELLQIPELMPPLTAGHHHLVPGASGAIGASGGGGILSHGRHSDHASDRRKRKSRRSVQREKLEKTFKEKGFLIQTQQLESAEGATYCKFRQLRKFTRYLFRSWKDYLPGDIQGQGNPSLQEAAGVAGVSLSDLESAQLQHHAQTLND